MSSYISFEALTILAIILGPVVAVVTSRSIDKRMEKRHRRWSIFCDLMKRRHETLNESSWSLNLIHAEFHDKKNVLDAWETLHNFLKEHSPQKDSLEKSRRKKVRLLAKLLQEMAKSLGVKLDDHIINATKYSPRGTKKAKTLDLTIKRKLVEVLNGEAPITIRSIENTSDSSDKSDPSDKDTKSNKAAT